MWAAVAAAFVFAKLSLRNLQRHFPIGATLVSIRAASFYLLVAPPSAVGMAILLAIGALIMILDRRGELIDRITTIVVMVVAMLSRIRAASLFFVLSTPSSVWARAFCAASWSPFVRASFQQIHARSR